ncbi:hypothetical protein UA75_16080 [Actinoalloteichus sp. GBA129-24]|uniref:Uncharacterized protein n=1 Tax=Actinoalloteichus fjordicus TaxID=1612552 RepID=A0AAC9PST3_9PSEU|nr:hypothetical protein UA74_15515 [Actinoalloteichus fjordicus]APU21225.1 hypothetical protein UA75_16080 [Actinoalloteichus sp. GBA129-24]
MSFNENITAGQRINYATEIANWRPVAEKFLFARNTTSADPHDPADDERSSPAFPRPRTPNHPPSQLRLTVTELPEKRQPYHPKE